MKKNKNEEMVICIYDEQGVSITEKILEAFEKYINSSLQNNSNI